MDISIDFLTDWKNHMRSRIAAWGYASSVEDSLETISYRFFNIWNRRIDPRPRRVHEAKNFEFQGAHAAGYDRLRRALLAGEDVNHYLSKSLLDADYSDGLLNDWSIHHFHLGDEKDHAGFISRTGPLLFAKVFHSDILCIAILPHGSWSNRELLKIIHHNWPVALEPYRVKGISGVSVDYSDQEIAMLRKGRVNAFVEIEPGVVYGMIGGGYMADGTSMMTRMQTMKYEQLIIDLEMSVRGNAEEMASHIASQGFDMLGKLDFRLHIGDDGFHAVETTSRTSFLLLWHDDLRPMPATSPPHAAAHDR